MNKEILSDYIDACALVKETQKDIARLQKGKMIDPNIYSGVQ